jgi:hypothetical protein
MSTTDGPVRVGLVTDGDHEVVVVALFGMTVATSRSMVEAYRNNSDFFTTRWTEYFTNRLVSSLTEQLQAERGVQGWALATRLAPRAPQLPKEGEEG